MRIILISENHFSLACIELFSAYIFTIVKGLSPKGSKHSLKYIVCTIQYATGNNKNKLSSMTIICVIYTVNVLS